MRRAVAALDPADLVTVADRLIDEKLDEELRAGTIRLVRASWLISSACPAVMPRCQDLPPNAHFSPSDASEMLSRGDRSVLALSHGWVRMPLTLLCLPLPLASFCEWLRGRSQVTAAHPDPFGHTLLALKRYLRAAPDAAVFVE